MHPAAIPMLFGLALPACLIWAAASDLRTMTIPNRLNLILFASFFPVAVLLSLDPSDILVHVGLAVAALFVGFAGFAFRVIGGGDAKLLAATTLWFGLGGMVTFLTYTAIAGGAFTLMLLLARQSLQIYTPTLPEWIQTLLKPKGDIPYGVAICVGGLLSIPSSDLWPLLNKLAM